MTEDKGGEPMREDEVLRLFDRHSNAGRWGDADEQGTLNLISPGLRVTAARSVELGVVVSLAHPLVAEPDGSVQRQMLPSGNIPSASDRVSIAPHGFQITHLDALGHVSHGGTVYNGRAAADAITADGLTFGSIFATRGGIVTRGVLLDVAAARGVPFLPAGAFVEPDDLDRAATRSATAIQAGDAVLIRVGLGARESVEGPEDPRHRAGLSPSCLGWLRDHDVALYGGDCIERLPSGYPLVPLPFHAVALSAMGLAILDNVDMEVLRDTCVQLDRQTFLLVVAPLPIERGTVLPRQPARHLLKEPTSMGQLKVGSAPVTFGVDEVQADGWRPTPASIVEAIASLGLQGTELGPPGFFGEPKAARELLERHDLALIASYLPLRLSRAEHIDADLAALQVALEDLRKRTPVGSTPKAILADLFCEPDRLAWAGAIDHHPEALLSRTREELLVASLHRAGELCQAMGFDAVVHPHAGTYIETEAEVRFVADRLDPAVVGLVSTPVTFASVVRLRRPSQRTTSTSCGTSM